MRQHNYAAEMNRCLQMSENKLRQMLPHLSSCPARYMGLKLLAQVFLLIALSEDHRCVWTQKKKTMMRVIMHTNCQDHMRPPFCPLVWENDGAEQCLDCGALTDIHGGGLIDVCETNQHCCR